MKLIKPSYEILEQSLGLKGIYKAIEVAGRTCYKSLDKITDDSAEGFVSRMIASKHYAMLEHGTVYLLFSECCYHRPDVEFIDKYIKNPYSKVVCIGTDDDLVEQTPEKNIYLGDILGTGVYGNALYAITTNYRHIVENDWLDDLKYLCEPTEFHEKRVTVKFTSMIQFYKDLTRHRKMSYAIESTRYCNYSKDKFGNELTFIIPSWLSLEEGSYEHHEINNMDGIEGDFLRSLKADEEMYLRMINLYKLKPQQAAKLLPQDTKADIIVTGFVSDWSHIFMQRTSIIAETGIPDTEVSLLMDSLYKEFIERKFI